MKKKEYILKNISPFAVIKTSTLFFAAIVAIIGGITILETLLTKGWKAFSNAVLGTLFGLFILSPAYGLVSGAIVAIYNWVAKKTGGYQVTLEVEEKD